MKRKIQYKGYSILEVIVSTILITITFLLFAGLVSKVLFTRGGADETKILMQDDVNMTSAWLQQNLPGCKTDSSLIMMNGISYRKKRISNTDGKILREWYVLSPERNLYYTQSTSTGTDP